MWKYVLIIVVLFSLFGCDYFTSEIEDDKHARLEVYYEDNLIYDEELNDEDDSLSVIIDLPDQSQITLDKFVNIIYSPDLEEESYRSYIAWARKADYYTQCAHGYYLDTLQINASEGFTPVVPGEVCGTIYSTNHSPVTNMKYYIFQDSVIIDSFITSSNGYFNVDITLGTYELGEEIEFCPYNFIDFIVDSYYNDYAIISFIQVPKPIIYIYPEEKMEISVYLDFTHGGNLTTSIPEYGSGWKNLNVDPTGKINGEFNYLFYESQNPDFCQYNEGWIIAQQDLENFFIQNLAETGFEGQEIIDFTDFWIPLLTDHPYYAIYPQYKEQLNKMVKLEFSVEPDNLLRLFYVIEGMQDNSLNLQKPVIPNFQREGFYVVEWGLRIRNKTELSVNK